MRMCRASIPLTREAQTVTMAQGRLKATRPGESDAAWPQYYATLTVSCAIALLRARKGDKLLTRISRDPPYSTQGPLQ